MWSNDEKHFHGKKHGDTVSFDDSALLSKFQGAPVRIKELTVAHNGNNIIGLQAVYQIYGWNQTVSGPQNFGRDHSGLRTDVISLNDNEFITEVSGRAGDIFDSLAFKSSSGRTWEFGGHGGNPFKLTAPYGKQFSVLRGGLGGHLHNLDLVATPLPSVQAFQPFQPQQDELFRGKRHGDTVSFSDEDLLRPYGGEHKIHTIVVYHDGKSVYGVQAKYFVFGPNKIVEGPVHVGKQANHSTHSDKVELQSDEYITELHGRHGDIFDNFGFTTSKGRKFEWGGNGGNHFELKAPHGRHFAVLRGGLGGHLHNVDFVANTIYQQPQQFKEQEFRRGKTHGDTLAFSDRDVLSKYPPTAKIWKLTVYHDKNTVFGWKADYFVFGPNIVVEGKKHIGSQWSNNGVEEVVELGPNEYITEIHGRHGDIMDNFGFSTSEGRKFNFGGSGGNAFDVKAPRGHHFGTLGGGLGGHVHNVEFNPVPLHHHGQGW